MHFQTHGKRWHALHDRISSSLIAVISVVRGLSLFLSGRPGTPLRGLCIMAFDTLHKLRNPQRLPLTKLKTLAVFLDFGACANAAFDNKRCRQYEYRRSLHLLEEAGIRSFVDEYLRRLESLESNRPLPGGDPAQFNRVLLYREAVIRLSLGMVAATVAGNHCLDEGIRATWGDAASRILFQIVMQCQIIDDVLDYSKDMAAGLPGFLTACKSLPQAFARTRLAAHGYADDRDLPRTGDLFPLRVALILVSTLTRLVLLLGRWKYRGYLGQQFAERVRLVNPV